MSRGVLYLRGLGYVVVVVSVIWTNNLTLGFAVVFTISRTKGMRSLLTGIDGRIPMNDSLGV